MLLKLLTGASTSASGSRYGGTYLYATGSGTTDG
jgi:hypothetical protein